MQLPLLLPIPFLPAVDLLANLGAIWWFAVRQLPELGYGVGDDQRWGICVRGIVHLTENCIPSSRGRFRQMNTGGR